METKDEIAGVEIQTNEREIQSNSTVQTNKPPTLPPRVKKSINNPHQNINNIKKKNVMKRLNNMRKYFKKHCCWATMLSMMLFVILFILILALGSLYLSYTATINSYQKAKCYVFTYSIQETSYCDDNCQPAGGTGDCDNGNGCTNYSYKVDFEITYLNPQVNLYINASISANYNTYNLAYTAALEHQFGMNYTCYYTNNNFLNIVWNLPYQNVHTIGISALIFLILILIPLFIIILYFA